MMDETALLTFAAELAIQAGAAILAIPADTAATRCNTRPIAPW